MTEYTLKVVNEDTGDEHNVAAGTLAEGEETQHVVQVKNPDLVVSLGN